MSWPVFVLFCWGVAVTCAWSHITRPERDAFVWVLAWIERKVGSPKPWLSTGPCCPACVAFHAAWVGQLCGLGPVVGGGVLAVLTAGFVVYGIVFVAVGVVARLTDGIDSF